mmetsp:Transcript_25345/g.58251  ORF Transcript_25345/g.58251 Transcript_25345/m.58251 type:complete len:381 (-) Transcript_25345:29-1171(-)
MTTEKICHKECLIPLLVTSIAIWLLHETLPSSLAGGSSALLRKVENVSVLVRPIEGNPCLPLSDQYRICRVPVEQEFGFNCKGKEYDQFADKLEALLDNHTKKTKRLSVSPSSYQERPASWGKRTFPFPPNSTILAVGNSLIRQVFQQLPCQYGDQVVSWIDKESHQENFFHRGTFYHGRFSNGAQVYLVTNHAMFYAPKWPQYLQELIGEEEWNKVDLMVVGRLNNFVQAYNTSFAKIMQEQTKKWDGADFRSMPPNLTDFASVFHRDRPIVGISMMADWSSWDEDYYDMKQQQEQSHATARNKQNNVHLVHGRQYIDQIGECGSESWWKTGICAPSPYLHRCIGNRGGHPDLIAFDAVETINMALDRKLSSKEHLLEH